jgi:hypothetical protein
VPLEFTFGHKDSLLGKSDSLCKSKQFTFKHVLTEPVRFYLHLVVGGKDG